MSDEGIEYDAIIQDGPKKVDLSTNIDVDELKDAYEDVRSDTTDTEWLVLKYEGTKVVCSAKGTTFDGFREQFGEDERAFGYIRMQIGDEMSKRQKFVLVTWVGKGVGVIKRAKMSTDKALVKNIITNFAVEIQLETLAEFELNFFQEKLVKASGANYGTGVRDL